MRVTNPLRAMLRAGLLAACLGGSLAATLAPRDAFAIDANRAVVSASRQITSVTEGLGAIHAAIQKSRGHEKNASQRIADAVLLMGSKDFERAITVLNTVLEKYPDHPTAYPDALSMLGEAYFRSKQLLSARRSFMEIVSRSGERRFADLQVKALGRLVDIALRTKDFDALDKVFALIGNIPAGAASSGLAYARGKGLFVKKDLPGAKAALGSVQPGSEYAHQARYLLALIAMKEATPPPVPLQEGQDPPPVPRTRYVAAIDLFQKVTELSPDTPEHRRVIDLSWLAIGRLLYETEQYHQAIQAYNHIDRSSPEFGTMLYELAWVYVRLGDVERSQRALEVLAIVQPDSRHIADGSLLRGDLMLRAGQFEKSLKVYEGVRTNYDPMREKVDTFLGSTSDPAVYYDKLSQEDLEALDNSSLLPPIAVEWAREAEDGPAAFAVIDDVALCRDLLKQSNDLIERLTAVLSSTNRVRAFPELKAGEERALSLINRVSLARLSLGQGMDDIDSSGLSGEIATVRARRRALEKRLVRIPVTAGDFQDRENEALSQWNRVSQALQRLDLQIDTIQATINGLGRVLREGPQAGVVRDPATVARFQAELAQAERDVVQYRKHVEQLRKYVNAGRVQVGFGDQRFVDDAHVRKQYRDALSREVALAATGAAGSKLERYAKRIQPVLRAGDGADARIEAILGEIAREVRRKSTDLQQILARETANVVNYSVRLEQLDREARSVVGEVAMRNFGLVRDRLRDIVLRADVGITEEAWEVREEQITRVRALQIERSREDRTLKEELNEVLDDSGEGEVPK